MSETSVHLLQVQSIYLFVLWEDNDYNRCSCMWSRKRSPDTNGQIFKKFAAVIHGLHRMTLRTLSAFYYYTLDLSSWTRLRPKCSLCGRRALLIFLVKSGYCCGD